MEIFMLQSRFHFPQASTNLPKLPTTTTTKLLLKTTKRPSQAMTPHQEKFDPSLSNDTLLVDNSTTIAWNTSDAYGNTTNSSYFNFDYDYQMLNASVATTRESWTICKEWTPAQHTLFQTANFFFAAAFLVPGSFKQSVLLVRALLSFGFIFLTFWAGIEVCAPDILLWNILLVILNLTHTLLLAWRFLPPTLTLELTELYLKVFKPLRVSKKHFKELVKEAQVINLERGDIYAVEDVSAADEKLSILLRGKLRVTCEDTHLHFINAHQFVDSPEWEANHDQSDDVFQVSITAEEDSVYLCWPRMRLERILRHRPMLKTILDSIIGKDITQKLYSLNEHLSGLEDDRKRGRRDEMWARAHSRSMSMDAVNTGTTGLVRSTAYKISHRKHSLNSAQNDPLGGLQAQCWVPLVANQFPAVSPFMAHKNIQQHQRQDSATNSPFLNSTTSSSLRLPGLQTPTRTRSFRKNREVKFKKYLK